MYGFVWGFLSLLWRLTYYVCCLYRSTLDQVTLNSLLEVHIRVLQNTSGRFLVPESQCVMKYRGKDFIDMLIITLCFKKLPSLCGTQMFVTVFTKAHHWTLSWASPQLHILFCQRYILIISTNLLLVCFKTYPTMCRELGHLKH